MEAFETPRKVTEWLTNMGYNKKFPKDLKAICNPSTVFIWEQIIAKVKPKQEIQMMRYKILINQLSKNGETCLDPNIHFLKHEFDYKIKEIEVLNKKKTLEREIDLIKNRISDAEMKLKQLNKNNKMKYMNLDNLKHLINENNTRLFLLNEKREQLEKEAEKVDDLLNLACYLTPIESEGQTEPEVLETLKKCTEKLEKIVDQQDEANLKQIKVNSKFKTPLNIKLANMSENFISMKKSSNVFTSTQIVFNHTKQLDDSLGLLEDFSGDNFVESPSFCDLNFSYVNNYDLAILNDQEWNGMLEDVLHKNNRLVLWNLISERGRKLKDQLIEIVIENDKILCSPTSENNDELFLKLYIMHVDYKLKTRKTEHNIKNLLQKVNQLEEKIFSVPVGELENLKLKLREVELVTAVDYLHELTNSLRDSFAEEIHIESIQEEARYLEENILKKLTSIEQKFAVFKQVHESMTRIRAQTNLVVRKLSAFSIDGNWTSPLLNNSVSQEIHTFFELPIEHNRVVSNNSSKTFVRDLPLNFIPYQAKEEPIFFYVLSAILQNPCIPGETLLSEILKSKSKIQQLKAMKYIANTDTIKQDCWDVISKRESCNEYVWHKLNSLINNNSVSKPSYIYTNLQEVIDLWLTMPIKDYISSNSLFNGKPYTHYEKIFEKFYQQL